jgi:uncharacterized glyoxalase superfamily protein PhnB
MNASVWPNLGYRDAPGAIRFLVTAFGFEEEAIYDEEDKGAVGHAVALARRWRGHAP